MPDSFLIRVATLTDVPVIARHRAAMFEDMGSMTPDLVGPLVAESEQFLREAIPRGDYRGWLAALAESPEQVIGGVGVQVRRVSPFPRRGPDGRVTVARGMQGLVINVFTEAAFRRRGLARRLMNELLSWARAAALDSLILHAAPAGRALYEEQGFAPTNEMRFMGEL